MKAFVATSIIGSFAFSMDGTLLEKRLFPKKPETIINKLNRAMAGEIIEEELEIIKVLRQKGVKEIIWDKKKEVEGITCIYDPDNKGKKALQEEYRKLALELRWVNSQAELNEMITGVTAAMAKEQIGKPKKDRIIMAAVGVYDEVEKTANVLSERLKEWYGLLSPEALKKGNEELAKALASSPEESKDRNAVIIREYAAEINSIFEFRKALKTFIENEAEELIPNTSAIAGHLLAARLLLRAGGLDKLAKLPSSTMQLLGSERALFRHLKGKGRSPRFGILFAHPYIQKAPNELRGKIARIISLKLTLAARIDCYSKENRSEALKKQLNDHIGRFMKDDSKTLMKNAQS